MFMDLFAFMCEAVSLLIQSYHMHSIVLLLFAEYLDNLFRICYYFFFYDLLLFLFHLAIYRSFKTLSLLYCCIIKFFFFFWLVSTFFGDFPWQIVPSLILVIIEVSKKMKLSVYLYIHYCRRYIPRSNQYTACFLLACIYVGGGM